MTKKDKIKNRYLQLIIEDKLSEQKITETLIKEFKVKETELDKIITDEVKAEAEQKKNNIFKDFLKREIKKNLKGLAVGAYPPETLKEQVGAVETLYKIYRQLMDESDKKELEIATKLTYEDIKGTEKALKGIFEEMVKDGNGEAEESG